MIDYILKTTRNDSLYYVGHSLGCTVFFVALNMRPEYSSKVKLMIALAPAVYGSHLTNKKVKTIFAVAGHVVSCVSILPPLLSQMCDDDDTV